MNTIRERHCTATAPGRTELAGNHTDHQGGRVIAAAIDRFISIELAESPDMHISVSSEGYAPVDIQLDAESLASSLAALPAENGTTAALVRGVAAGFAERGAPVRGFTARVSSTIPVGGGLSSSAAFEIALGRALNAVFADNRIRTNTLIDIACDAERKYFGKPCGQMDQTAIAYGGINLLDFSDEKPQVTPLDFDFEECGYRLVLIDTHTDHAACTDEYAQVPADMIDVALLLGAPLLSQISEQEFFERFGHIRKTLGDLPALRALHYFNEMHLVDERAAALSAHDMPRFLRATRESGLSSALFLQNIAPRDSHEQPVTVALALAERALNGKGAVRIHGGGFGGYIQAFVPLDSAESFVQFMDRHLGEGSSLSISVVQANQEY